MTVERCTGTTGTGTGTFLSARYSCTVNGITNYVQEWVSTNENGYSAEANFGETLRRSWCKFGADETTTVVVTRLAGAITSVNMRPHFDDVTTSISGGLLTLTVPAGRCFRVDVNASGPDYLTKEPLFIWSSMLQDAIPSGSVSWVTYLAANPGATSIPDNTKIHFPQGEHAVGLAFEVGNNCIIHIDRNATVNGSFCSEDGLGNRKTGVVFQGTGCIHYSTIDPVVTVDPLPVALKMFYSAFSAPTADGNDFFTDQIVRGITLFAIPYHVSSGGVNVWEDCQHLAYARGGTGDSLSCRPRLTTRIAERTRCFAEAGDDAFDCLPLAVQTDEDCVVGTSLNSCWKTLYWSYPDISLDNLTITNCHAYHMADADTDTPATYPQIGAQTILLALCDAPEDENTEGRFDVTVNGLTVHGKVNSRFMVIGNYQYPYGTPTYDVAGQVARWSLNDITITETPGQISKITGRDRNNTPNNIFFRNLSIGGVEVTARNYSDFFDINTYPYRIHFGRHPVATEVDICNLALSFLGDSATITGIDPSDGTAQADACARFYDIALNGILEMHPWGFATKYVALTEIVTNERTEWDYSYQIPADMLRPLLILPPDTIDDYPVQPSPQVEFTLEQDENDDLVLYTDQEDAVLRYTAYTTNTGFFPPLFQIALAWHLASMLAGTLIKGEQGAAEARRCTQMMMSYLAKARETDSHARVIKPTHTPNWMSDR